MPFCGKNHKNSRSFGVQNHFRHFLGTFLGVQKNFCCSARRILGFKSIFIVSPKHFHPSKVFLRPIRGVFSLQKFFCCSARRILGFKRTFIASPKRFHLSKVLLRLAWRVFSLQKFFHCLPEAFSAFKSIFVPHPRRFVARQSLAYRLFVCSQCSHFCRFAAKSTKIRAYSVRFWRSKARSLFSLASVFSKSRVRPCETADDSAYPRLNFPPGYAIIVLGVKA